MSGSTIKIIAIISSYNEEDVIHHVIGDLIENDVEVYLIDNRSIDGPVKAATAWLGNADNILGQLLVQSPEMAARIADFRRPNQCSSHNPN